MKRLLLVLGLLAMSACTKDLTENAAGSGEQDDKALVLGEPTQAVKGFLRVQLSPTAAAMVESKTATRAEDTRSGIVDMDKILDEIGAEKFTRVVPYNAIWEAAYAETGLNRWYSVWFDNVTDMARAADLLAMQENVQVVEYALRAEFMRPQRKLPEDLATATREILPVSASASTRAQSSFNDPYLSYQWHFDNVGDKQNYVTPPVAGADVSAFDAWRMHAGSPAVVVAVLDDAVYTEHPDLKANIWSHPANSSEHGRNFLRKASAGQNLDWKSFEVEQGFNFYSDHGTHVAGVIAAVNNNGTGVAGIAGGNNGGGVKIMSCQVLGSNVSDADYNPNANIDAFNYALTNGAIIAQNSWGFTANPDLVAAEWEKAIGSAFASLKTAIRTFVNSAGSQNPNSPLKGGLVIFAAGNNGETNRGVKKIYPAADESVVAVGSMSWDYRPAYYTDYGPWVDISAPGGDALSAKPLGGDDSSNGEVFSTFLCDNSINYTNEYPRGYNRKDDPKYGYGFMQGTSMACPHVSGVAALGLSYAAQLGKSYTVAQFKALLLSAVKGIDQHFVGTKRTYTGTINTVNYINKMGGGCTDAYKLLLAIRGTPALYAKTGEANTIDFTPFFGGADAKISLISISSTELSNIGLESIPPFGGGKSITITPTKVGAALIKVKGLSGKTIIERELAIVSRSALADNGGWL